MRGVGTQLGQVRQVDVVFGARSRSHYGLKMLSLDWWNSCGVREGWTRRWLFRPKRVWSLSASLCKGLSSRNALGTQSVDAYCTDDLCSLQLRSEQRSFECVRRVEARSGCSCMRGPGGSRGSSQLSRSGERGLGRRRVPKGVSCSARWSQ